MSARRYITIIQDEHGYPPLGELDPAPPDGPKPPVVHTVVLADEYDRLSEVSDALATAKRMFPKVFARYDFEVTSFEAKIIEESQTVVQVADLRAAIEHVPSDLADRLAASLPAPALPPRVYLYE